MGSRASGGAVPGNYALGQQPDQSRNWCDHSNIVNIIRILSSNVLLLPTLEFMQKISVLVQEYVKTRLESDASWKNLKVILSDSSVPGEGEHKVRFNN
jgi:5'-3' exonuclease